MIRPSSLLLLLSTMVAGAEPPDLFTVDLPVVSDPTVLRGYAKFDLATSGTVGQPALPVVPLRFLLAPDADMATISLAALDTVSRILPADYVVQPVLAPVICGCLDVTPLPNSAARMTEVAPVASDTGIYHTNAWFPSIRFQYRTGALGQYKLLDLTYSPYVYNPVTLKLKKIESGKIRVNFDRIPDLAQTNFGRTERYEAMIRGSVKNDASVFALYEGSPTAKANTFQGGKGHFEMMLPGQGGSIQMPFANSGSHYQVSVRGLDRRRQWSGIALREGRPDRIAAQGKRRPVRLRSPHRLDSARGTALSKCSAPTSSSPSRLDGIRPSSCRPSGTPRGPGRR